MTKFIQKPLEVEAITFDELVEHGREVSTVVENGMPWSFDYKGLPITHENDRCYLIPHAHGSYKMTPECVLVDDGKGFIYPCDIDAFELCYQKKEEIPKQDKTLDNTNIDQAKEKIDDLVVHGNGDAFQLIRKASSESEGWMKSTKAMEIYGLGCLVQVTTQQGNHVAEALTFVPGATIGEDFETKNKTLEATYKL